MTSADNAPYVKLVAFGVVQGLPRHGTTPISEMVIPKGRGRNQGRPPRAIPVIYRDPKGSGGVFLYRIYDSEGRPLYIGQTANVEQRFRNHLKGAGSIAELAGAIDLEEHEDRRSAIDAENQAIRREQPWLNYVSNPRAKARARRGKCRCYPCYFGQTEACWLVTRSGLAEEVAEFEAFVASFGQRAS